MIEKEKKIFINIDDGRREMMLGANIQEKRAGAAKLAEGIKNSAVFSEEWKARLNRDRNETAKK